jgi:hypothetical protein
MRPQTFFNTIFKSFTSVEYYLDVLKAPLWFTFRFFLISFLILGIYTGWQAVTATREFIATHTDPTIASLIKNFPEDGKIHWTDKGLEVNPDPFVLAVPLSPEEMPLSIDNLMVLTAESGQPQEILKKHNIAAPLVLANTMLFAQSENGSWESVDFAEDLGSVELLITTETLPGILESLKSGMYEALPLIEKIIWGGAVAVIIVSGILRALINGLIIMLLSKIASMRLGYWKSVQFSLHLLVPLEVIHLLAQSLYPSLNFSIVSIGFWVLSAFFFVTQREKLLALK